MATALTTIPERTAASTDARRSATLRGFALALSIAVAGAAIAAWHDGAIANREMAMTQYVAPLAMGLLFVALLVINGALALLGRRWALRAGELGVIAGLLLMTAPVARHVVQPLVGTVGYTRALIEAKHPSVAELQRVNPYATLPESALLPLAESRRFEQGIDPAEAIAWRAWLPPLIYWLPLVGLFLTLSASLGFTLYRQWSQRELAPFPLAELTADLLETSPGRRLPDVFSRPGFWIGWGLVVAIFTINGLHAHFEKMIEIPTKFAYYELVGKFPFLKESHEGYSLLRGWLFLTIVAVAVILPAEISLTSWATWPVMVVASYIFYTQTGRRFTGNDNSMVMMGAAWAMAGLILYAGRTFYWNLLKRVIGRRTSESIDGLSVGAARIFLLSAAALAVVLVSYGIPVDLAVLWVLCAVVMLLVVCRLVVEMGIPWTPLGSLAPLSMLLAALGKGALGMKAYAMLSVFGSLMIPTRGSMMLAAPAVLTGARVDARLNDGRVVSARLMAPFVMALIVLCASLAIWAGYSSSGEANDYHTDGGGISEVRSAADSIAVALAVPRQGDGRAWLENGGTPSMWERWRSAEVRPQFVGFFVFGFAMVLVTGIVRLKCPRFPLHPLPLVLLGSWVMSRFWGSFLIGWLIKTALLKAGGAQLFARTRPFWVGVLSGQAVIFTTWLVVNLLIYQSRGGTFDPQWLDFLYSIYSN